MQDIRFKLISRGSKQEKLHLVVNVTNAAGAVQYCLVVVIGRQGQALSLQDLKQASADDVRNYLLQVFKSDVATTTVQFDLTEDNLVQNLVEGVVLMLGKKLLGITENQPVGQMDKAKQYMTNSKGNTAWESVLKSGGKTAAAAPKSAPRGGAPRPAVPASGSRPAGTRPLNPALSRPPMAGADEPTLDSILGGDESAPPPVELAGPQEAVFEKLEKVTGIEGRLVHFTARYSKLLMEMSEKIHKAPKGDIKTYAAISRDYAPLVAKLATEVTQLTPEFYVSQSAGKVEKALNQLYIRRLPFNLPEIKDKGKGDLSKLLTMEIGGTKKQDPQSITVEFLYQKRFGVPPELGDTLRDLLRFEWGTPLGCEESFPFITRKVDITKLYYVYSGSGRKQDTDIFFFRELDGRCGMVYVPYHCLGTGIMNAAVNDFFSQPWSGA